MFKMILLLPDEVEAAARKRLECIRTLHREEKAKGLAMLANDPKVTKDGAYIFDRMVAERSKRITFQNMIKAFVNLGMAMPKEYDRVLLKDMAETGLPMGRPVVKASKKGKLRVAGAKR